MRDFSDGVRLNENGEEYQSALQEYSDGLVVSLNRSRQGKMTLHRTTCTTLSYDLQAKGSQSDRSGKVLFRDRNELNDWVGKQANLEIGDLNHCSRCMQVE